MVQYDLTHLVQDDTENVIGPIQDTEALFLYSLVRGMRMRRVLEIGGLSGYSARNFLAALGPQGMLYTVDLNPVPCQGPNHACICRDAREDTAADLGGEPLDLVFFDCHVFDAQMGLFEALLREGLVTERTVLALHDTNLHPTQVVPWAYPVRGEEAGWVHQAVERDMVNEFVGRHGYHAFSLHTALTAHDASMPFRHGVTLLQRFRPLTTAPAP